MVGLDISFLTFFPFTTGIVKDCMDFCNFFSFSQTALQVQFETQYQKAQKFNILLARTHSKCALLTKRCRSALFEPESMHRDTDFVHKACFECISA